jgi:hypothetical protein
MMSSFGDSGLPVFQAGHWLWHRPHSVQVYMSRKRLNPKCSRAPTPRMSSSPIASTSIFSASSLPSAFGCRANSTFGMTVNTWRCFEFSVKFTKPMSTNRWATRKAVVMISSDSVGRSSRNPPTQLEKNAPSG